MILYIYSVTISQTYKNIEKDTIEAFYKFPIHEAAAVCGFEAEIDGRRKIKGIVKESKEAAKEYTEAVQVISNKFKNDLIPIKKVMAFVITFFIENQFITKAL